MALKQRRQYFTDQNRDPVNLHSIHVGSIHIGSIHVGMQVSIIIIIIIIKYETDYSDAATT